MPRSVSHKTRIRRAPDLAQSMGPFAPAPPPYRALQHFPPPSPFFCPIERDLTRKFFILISRILIFNSNILLFFVFSIFSLFTHRCSFFCLYFSQILLFFDDVRETGSLTFLRGPLAPPQQALPPRTQSSHSPPRMMNKNIFLSYYYYFFPSQTRSLALIDANTQKKRTQEG